MVKQALPVAARRESTGVEKNNHHTPKMDVMPTKFLVKHEELEIDKLFRALVKLEGSDLHLKAERPPTCA